MDDKDVTVKIYLTSDLRARFKAKCALQEKSMNEVLLKFIHDFIDDSLDDSPTKGANGQKTGESQVTHR